MISEHQRQYLKEYKKRPYVKAKLLRLILLR